MTLATVMADTLAAFAAVGVRATDDARDANPPCVVVAWPRGEHVVGKGRVHLTMTAYLVVGDPGARAALAAMSDLLAKVEGLWSVTTFDAVGWQPTIGGDPVPAYQLTWQTTTDT